MARPARLGHHPTGVPQGSRTADLWAILEQGRALSSLTTQDAVATGSFCASPRRRLAGCWVGPSRPRSAPDWRPFQAQLSGRSIAYALSVILTNDGRGNLVIVEDTGPNVRQRRLSAALAACAKANLNQHQALRVSE